MDDRSVFRLEIMERRKTDGLDLGEPKPFFECVTDYDEADTAQIACALHTLASFLSGQIGAPVQLNKLTKGQAATLAAQAAGVQSASPVGVTIG